MKYFDVIADGVRWRCKTREQAQECLVQMIVYGCKTLETKPTIIPDETLINLVSMGEDQ